jgi:hypothetical protein
MKLHRSDTFHKRIIRCIAPLGLLDFAVDRRATKMSARWALDCLIVADNATKSQETIAE